VKTKANVFKLLNVVLKIAQKKYKHARKSGQFVTTKHILKDVPKDTLAQMDQQTGISYAFQKKHVRNQLMVPKLNVKLEILVI